jgi:hypothetical protein
MRNYRHVFLLLLVSVLTPPLFADQTPVQLTAMHEGPILLRAGSALVSFKLTSSAHEAIPLNLTFGPASDTTSGILQPSPKADFKLEAGNGDLPKQIDAGQTLDVVAHLTDLNGSSLAAIRLYNGSRDLGEWSVIAFDDPLNVTLSGDGGTDKPLQLVFGRESEIGLKNNSTGFLNLDWAVGIDGGPAVMSGTVAVAPGAIARIPVNPPFSAFAGTDFVHTATHSGELLLKLHVPSGMNAELAPQHILPLNLQMSGFNSFWITCTSYFYVAVFLFIGGLLSVIAGTVLPNYLKKLDFRKQIADLANRTSSVSTRVDSYLRVLLRLERKKIEVMLLNLRAFSLSATEDFSDLATAVGGLQKRLEVAERLDELRRQFETQCPTAPPSITDSLDRTLNTAAFQLHSFVLKDADVTAATALLDNADSLFKTLNDNDAQARTIAGNFTQLQNRLKQFPANYYADLKAALPGIFDILTNPFDDARNISPEMFFAIDHAIAAIHTLLNYAMVRASIPQSASSNCSSPGEGSLKRLQSHECKLIDMLGTLSWKALTAAISLVQQMREDIYEEDVLAQLQGTRARIIFDTQRARPYLPVFFSISFDDPRFNGAAALENVVVRWTFPEVLNEQGWKVCHYFQGNEGSPAPGGIQRISVQCDFFDSEGKQQSSCTRDMDVQTSSRPREYSRARAELLRFLIAFGVALAGLESGGLDQLSKLGFIQATIAIVALGFGADSVKNLLTQTSKPQPPAPPAPVH